MKQEKPTDPRSYYSVSKITWGRNSKFWYVTMNTIIQVTNCTAEEQTYPEIWEQTRRKNYSNL